jgi:hypothetical protein
LLPKGGITEEKKKYGTIERTNEVIFHEIELSGAELTGKWWYYLEEAALGRRQK